jgi:hypothetical protein
MSTIKHIIFGISAKGDNIINTQPGFRTYYPESEIEFNTWSYLNKVGSRIQKNNSINPWYKDRK